MKATLDDASRVRAALDGADDSEALVVAITAELKRAEPAEMRQLGAMGVKGVPVTYPIPNPCSDAALFVRALERHPAMVADAMRRLNERNDT